MKNFLFKHKYELLLLLFVSFYIFYFTIASFLKYDNFYTGRFDLGNMDQAVWNTIHGRIFQITDPNGTNIMSRLGFHADFILILLSPLYWLWSNPKMLLLTQSIILGLGAIFLYKLTFNILKNKQIALILSLAFLLSPSVNYTNLYDFHPVTLATTLLLGAFYFFITKRTKLFLFFAILAGLTKEHVWAVISIFGLILVFKNILKFKSRINLYKKGEFLLGICVFIISAFLFYYLIWHAIPTAKGGNHFALTYYSDFGNTATNIGVNILFSPEKIIKSVFTIKKLNYILYMFMPVGYLSFFAPFILIFTIPDFAINLLSNNTSLQEIYYQYTAVISAFVFISAIYGIKLLKQKYKRLPDKFIVLYLLLFSTFSAYLLGPLPFSKHPSIDMFTKPVENKDKINDFINSIPTRFSIAATNNLGSHLSRRQLIFTIPIGIDKADVILFLLNDPFAQPSLAAQKEMVKKLEKDKNYVQVYKLNDFVVFEKKNLYLLPNPKKGQTNLFPYSITALSNRGYEKSDINIEKEIKTSGNFKSYIISYESDGLKQYALMNIPSSRMPNNGFPVLILNHGYINPISYDTVNSYKSDADYFANKGYLVLKPDYRGNANSEITDTTLMRFAYPIDVLNLLASLENISKADSNNVYFWSHSMGGEVTLEVIEAVFKQKELKNKIKGAVFWAPVTDPIKWFSKSHLPTLQEATLTPFPYSKTFDIIGTPDSNPELWQSLSPLSFLQNINIPILIQHGTGDTTVPYEWSVELNNLLLNLNKNSKLISYPKDNHNLPLNWSKAVSDDLDFFNALQK